jgi:two-component system chemotaxis response regulator CheB
LTKIKVVVVDDSMFICNQLKKIINSQHDMEVVGLAPDPLIAQDIISNENPDVVTLDVDMPRMNGLEFLDQVMRHKPIPVIMISSLTEKGSETTMRALELGAVDFVTKPKFNSQKGLQQYSDDVCDKIRAASKTRIQAIRSATTGTVLPSLGNRIASTEKILVFGSSTGGTEALKNILIHLPSDCPGIVMTQHMPEGFTASFAARLDGLCKIRVKEAEQGDRILPGHAYLAPGHSHLLLKRSGANYLCELSKAEPVNRHRPSVDVLFRSAASNAGKNAIGIILTGMGKDGAAGMKEMHEAGAHTFAQDEASCVVFGMPKEAIARGGVDEIVPLQQMARKILEHLNSLGTRAFRV